MSVKELVDLFAKVGLDQYQAELHSDIAKESRLIKRGWEIADELKGRPGDQRSALASLYDHPNVQVRLNAARLTLGVAPAAAKAVVQAVAASKMYPQAMDAGMCLWALEQGIFTPS
jgi:hypothetical protein